MWCMECITTNSSSSYAQAQRSKSAEHGQAVLCSQTTHTNSDYAVANSDGSVYSLRCYGRVGACRTTLAVGAAVGFGVCFFGFFFSRLPESLFPMR